MSSQFNVGDQAVVLFSFSALTDATTTPPTRVLTTPTTATITATAPSGAVQTIAYPGVATSPATGMVQASVSCTEAGTWTARVVSTGAALGAESVQFTVVA